MDGEGCFFNWLAITASGRLLRTKTFKIRDSVYSLFNVMLSRVDANKQLVFSMMFFDICSV